MQIRKSFYGKRIFTSAYLDKVVLHFGSYKCLPLRFIDYNVKGIFTVTGWIGVAMVLSSLERKFAVNLLSSFNVNQRNR
jgi:hypothetical protein